MCFERRQGSVVVLGTGQGSSIASDDAKRDGIFRGPKSKWSEVEGWN